MAVKNYNYTHKLDTDDPLLLYVARRNKKPHRRKFTKDDSSQESCHLLKTTSLILVIVLKDSETNWQYVSYIRGSLSVCLIPQLYVALGKCFFACCDG